MERSQVHKTLSKPSVYLGRMFMFLIVVGFLVAILYAPFRQAFLANIPLNGLIVAVLLIGILHSFRQVTRLGPEIRWVNNFRIADPGLTVDRRPVLLAPMATMLKDRTGHLSLSTVSMSTIMDSIGARLDEARDTSRYLVGLLIFLGLLGTFWGLLETISSVGNTISSLDSGSDDSVAMFNELISALEAPLKGMGTAFSSSLFGLAGSLVLGFLDLQASQAQNRFYNELEEWLSSITQLSTADAADGGPAQLRYAILDMQRSLDDFGDKIQLSLENAGGEQSVKELAQGIEKLVKQMRAEQKVVREWVDEQAAHQSELAAVLRELTGRK